jgi:A/G-specific adenine glycosylase
VSDNTLYFLSFFGERMPDFHPVAQTLLDWFAQNMRPLPWRADYSPYHVWISEVMLQQTQMERGVEYFRRWIAALPDPPAVATAHEDEVLKLWEGLGYYSRARNLIKAARVMVRDHHGRVPDDEAALRALPGIGPYTARAIASLAFGHDLAVVDANVERVFSRLFDVDTPVRETATKRRIADLAQQLLPPGRARDYNQAVMEFGALVCRKNPDCGHCPLAAHCEARRLGIVAHRPVPGKQADIQHVDVATGVVRRGGLLFIQRRPEDGVWGGLWEFPGGTVEPGEIPEQTIVREYMEELEWAVAPTRRIATIRHGYTRFRVTLHCFELEFLHGDAENPPLHEATQCRWIPLADLGRYALPAGHRKLADMLSAAEGGEGEGEGEGERKK